MKVRRALLQVTPLAALGASALSFAAKSATTQTASKDAAAGSQTLDPRIQRSIPDVPGVAHTGHAFHFYRDLVKDKVVAINFMSIREEARFPITARMAQIARRLGDKLGSEVFLISVTRDPDHDTPQRLGEFAQQYSVSKGWFFVNCAMDGAAALQSRVYHAHEHANSSAGEHAPAVSHQIRIRSTDTVFYGNGGVGLWSNFPIEIHPEEAVRHISWVMPGRKPTGDPRRAGPRRLNSLGRSSDNRLV